LRDAAQSNRHLTSYAGTRIASQSFCPRESIMGTLGTGKGHRHDGEAGGGGGIDLYHDTLLAQQLYARPSVGPTAPVARSRRGADPTTSGCSSTLTWRGLAVALPFHCHCSRRGQGRQLRMLAAYTIRRLPSASRRRSWATSDWPAGQRSVPSGWRAKSCPEKRPCFQGRATSAGPYPCGGEDESGA